MFHEFNETKRWTNTWTLFENWENLWNMRMTVLPIIIAALGTIPKEFVKGMRDLDVREQVETIQIMVLLRSAELSPENLKRLSVIQTTICHRVDFAVPLDLWVKSQKIDKYLDLARELRKTVENEDDDDNNWCWFAWNSPKCFERKQEKLVIRGSTQAIQIVDIDENTEKVPETLRVLPSQRLW